MSEQALLLRLRAGPVSGDVLAREAGQTRAAIWKRIAALREAGIAIDALPGRGYALREAPDLLDADAIVAALPAQARQALAGLEVAWKIDSTNSALLREPAPARGCRVLLAERQSAGRGRRGRSWVSPLGAQLAVSLARRFQGGLARLPGLSLVAGVAAAEALHALGFAQVRLKWPNDIVVVDAGGLRKLGGILVEGGGEAGGAAQAVIGIGLNVRMPAAAMAGIGQPWTDLAALGQAPARNAIAAALLARLLPALDAFDQDGLAPWLARFETVHALDAADVLIHDTAGTHPARVRDPAGTARNVYAGDVSVVRA